MTARTLPTFDLPPCPIRAHGPWVLVLVSPRPPRSTILDVIESYDHPADVAEARVWSVGTHYWDLPPDQKGKNKTPRYEDKTFLRTHEVRVGEVVYFRRFLHTHKELQPVQVATPLPAGWSPFFVHVNDILGARRFEEERDEEDR